MNIKNAFLTTLLGLFVFSFSAVAQKTSSKKQTDIKKQTKVKNELAPPVPVATPISSETKPKIDVKNIGRAPGNYNIKVKINGLKNVSLFLADNFGDKQYMRDTCQLDNNGVGVFSGNPKLQRGLYMIVFPEMNAYFELPITEDQDFSFEGDTSVDETKIKIIGSTENAAFVEYQIHRVAYGKQKYDLENQYKNAKATKNNEMMAQLKPQIEILEKQDMDFRNGYIAKYPQHLLTKIFKAFEPVLFPKDVVLDSMQQYYFYRTHFWDNFDLSETGLIRAPGGLLIRKLNEYIDRVSFQDFDSLIVSVDDAIGKTLENTETQKYFVQHLTAKFQDKKIMCMDNVTYHIINKYYCTGKAWWYDDTAGMRKMCEESKKAIPTYCGKTAPNLKLADTSGNYKTLYENMGKVTILFFYDPTCGHCKEVMPVVAKVHDKLSKYGVKVYAVSTENKYDEWRAMMRKNPDMKNFINVCKTDRYYPWPIYKNDYNITVNPTLFVLDENGRILGKKIDEHQLEYFIESILYEKKIINYKPELPKEKPAKKDEKEG